MSRWVDRILEHGLWTSLGAIEPSIKIALDRDAITADMVDSLERIQTVVMYGTQRLSATDPVLVPPQALENLLQSANQMKANIDAFTGNGDIGQLNAANSQADSFLVNLNLVYAVDSPKDIAAISEATGAYRKVLKSHLEEALATQHALLEKAAANETRIQAIEVALNNEQQKLSVLISQHQSEFSAAQDKRASEFAVSQADYLAKYTTAATDQQTQFSTDQDARKSAFSTLQLENQEKLTMLMAEYEKTLKTHDDFFIAQEQKTEKTHAENLEALKNNYEEQAAAVLVQINQHKKEVESLVGVIGNLGVTSGYKKVADYAKWMTLVWQVITVLALAGLVAVAAAVAFPDLFGVSYTRLQKPLEVKVGVASQMVPRSTGEKSKEAPAEAKVSAEGSSGTHIEAEFYQGLATRIFLSITFGIFAAYASRQASRFFETERRNRKLALELEALGPFIEPLEKQERDKFRIQIGDRSFGVSDHDACKLKDDDPVTVPGWIKSKEGIEALTGPFKEMLKSVSKQ